MEPVAPASRGLSCPNCRYHLTGLTRATTECCPECGGPLDWETIRHPFNPWPARSRGAALILLPHIVLMVAGATFTVVAPLIESANTVRFWSVLVALMYLIAAPGCTFAGVFQWVTPPLTPGKQATAAAAGALLTVILMGCCGGMCGIWIGG